MPDEPVIGKARRIGYNVIFDLVCDPATVRAELPEPLECDASGQVIIWFQQHHDLGVGGNGGIRDPSTSHFSEAVWKIPCKFEGKPYNYTFLAWTDSETLVSTGPRSGIPQRLGKVHLTELHPGDGIYDRPRAGLQIHVKVAGSDQIMRGSLELVAECAREDLPFLLGTDGPNIGRRYFYDAVGEKVLLNDLCGGWTLDWTMSDLWRATASWEQVSLPGDRLGAFEPREVKGAYYFFSDFDGTRPTRSIIHTYSSEERQPVSVRGPA
jgi:hypothetical protein